LQPRKRILDANTGVEHLFRRGGAGALQVCRFPAYAQASDKTKQRTGNQ